MRCGWFPGKAQKVQELLVPKICQPREQQLSSPSQRAMPRICSPITGRAWISGALLSHCGCRYFPGLLFETLVLCHLRGVHGGNSMSITDTRKVAVQAALAILHNVAWQKPDETPSCSGGRVGSGLAPHLGLVWLGTGTSPTNSDP